MDVSQWNEFILGNLSYILLTMTILLLVALLVFISINVKLSRLIKQYSRLMQGMEGKNIEGVLMGHIEEVRQANNNVDELSRNYKFLHEIAGTCVQNVGVVRFNAFDDTGSDLSFAVALLDAKGNGVILSSIFGRNESRTYAKPVTAGQSPYFLSDEEKQALSKAQEKCSYK